MPRPRRGRLESDGLLLQSQLPEYSTDLSSYYNVEGLDDQKDMEAQVCPGQFAGADIELGMDDSSMESFGIQPLPAPITRGNRDRSCPEHSCRATVEDHSTKSTNCPLVLRSLPGSGHRGAAYL
jgi:hypothetical protein